ncbi:hypothetical protein FRACYDRAFT_239426 [Fragilariopsis cylindrus CCMP1102]|uniref:Uncharacterized protein n=1 Tax=Fragilariopsis cylindrus CCMP1102 TaxID=635003 RepID=A0A1E7FGC2_9STRA|nr:hypothetical protein FRACYDRAFT_239426 [Fragilariopsis cylindrus CCMP1102]|eukprot:OEU16833.1 hypothetical protein FRACYDRAFT_239426 [Fragilariopsis cylindrus CCMP1102]
MLYIFLILSTSVIFAICSHNNWDFHPSPTIVDAAMHGFTSSFSSRRYNYEFSKERKNNQHRNRRRQQQLPWLPIGKLFRQKHSLSLLSLRGGGKKRDVDIVEHGSGSSNKSNGNLTCQENEPANMTSDSQEESGTEQPKSSKTSSSFLSSPFRMNEMARYEASMESVEKEEEDIENVNEIDAVGETDDKYTKSSLSLSSIHTEGSDDVDDDDDDDRKAKRRNKRKKKKRDERNKKRNTDVSKVIEVTIPTTATKIKNMAGSGGEETEATVVEIDTENPSDHLSSQVIDSDEDANLEGIEDTDSSNPLWKKRDRDQNSPLLIENPIPMNSDSNTTVSEATINNTMKLSDEESIIVDNVTTVMEPLSYVSSGAWVPIDNMITFGLASKFTSLKLSRKIRRVRKLTAYLTGLHGLMSGKPPSSLLSELLNDTDTDSSLNDKEPSRYVRKRIAAIEKAREGVERAQAAAEEETKRRKGLFGGLFGPKEERNDIDDDAEEDITDGESSDESIKAQAPKIPQKSPKEIEEELQRMERVREIDRLISAGQNQLIDLICEKDVLQRRPNPLFDYTTKTDTITAEIDIVKSTIIESSSNVTENTTKSESDVIASKVEIQASRKINFPPDDLVAEYLDMVMSTRRLTKMNHTYLWKDSELEEDDGDDDEESIGDDLFTASADAHRLYQSSSSSYYGENGRSSENGKNGNGKKGGGGSWLLRQSIGGGPSLGEKIGMAVETAAYKAVTAALMSFLARALSSLHGINVLKHSDIRLVLEQSPDLPPVQKDGIIHGSYDTYAEDTIKTVMRRKTRRSKKRSSKHRLSEDAFVQRDAVTETLLSHVQISAPLLKLFPLAWQRALLGNILTLSTAIISDFVDGLHFQILGHQLSFAFRPITEVDIARQMAGGQFNQRRYKAAEFEAAVQATAEDLKEELKFLDSWHERALGSGVLRTQIANMIARIVLTLTDEVLSGARMDLWSAQAGGPRMLAGLEHRIEEAEC